MRSVIPMKTAKIGYILSSSLLMALGLLLMFFPKSSMTVAAVICGITLAVFGVIKLVGYFSKDLYRLAFQYDFAFGIILLVMGMAILLNPKSLFGFISIIFGVYVFGDGLFKVQIALESKRFGIRSWWLILIFAVIASVFGLILIFKPYTATAMVTVFLGLTLLFEGALNLCTALSAVKIVKNQQPDVIEIDFKEDE